MPGFYDAINNFKATGDPATPGASGQGAQQFFDTSTGRAGQNALDLQGLNLFDPNTLAQLQQMFQPMFNQQQQNLTQQFMGTRNALSSEAGQNAGAIAAFKGYDPQSYNANAQARTNSSLSPQYFQAQGGLQASQLENLLNSVGQSGQFKANNLQGAAGINQGLANLFEQQRQYNVEQSNQPGIGEWLASGALGLGGALLGGPFGAALGAGLGGSLFGGGSGGGSGGGGGIGGGGSMWGSNNPPLGSNPSQFTWKP